MSFIQRFQGWQFAGAAVLAAAGGVAFSADPPEDGLRTDVGRLHLGHLVATGLVCGSISLAASALFSDRRRVMEKAKIAALQALAEYENQRNLTRMGIEPEAPFAQFREVKTLSDPHLSQKRAAELSIQLIVRDELQPKEEVVRLVSQIAERSHYVRVQLVCFIARGVESLAVGHASHALLSAWLAIPPSNQEELRKLMMTIILNNQTSEMSPGEREARDRNDTTFLTFLDDDRLALLSKTGENEVAKMARSLLRVDDSSVPHGP